MSVSGFKINNTIERYNYGDLDNISVSYNDLSPEVKTAIINKVTKDSIDNAGIFERTYITEVDTTSVTTASTDLHPSYYAYVAEEGSGQFERGYMYRITLDGTEYILPALRWYWSGSDGSNFLSKGVTFIGNLSLFCDASGFYDKLPNVPFAITNIYSLVPLVQNKIFLYTSTQGTHSIKIERIEYSLTQIPNSLIYGSEIKPIYEKKTNSTDTYSGICIGLNEMKNTKTTLAAGWNNIVNGDASIIVGNDNETSGQAAIAIGNRNISSGTAASAFGYRTTASGYYAESHGGITTASGMISTAHGYHTVANHKSQFVFGEYNAEDDSSESANSRGNFVEIVGNGTSSNHSNARTLDWSGNESLAGGITLGKGSADEVTLSAAQLKRLLALLS